MIEVRKTVVIGRQMASAKKTICVGKRDRNTCEDESHDMYLSDACDDPECVVRRIQDE